MNIPPTRPFWATASVWILGLVVVAFLAGIGWWTGQYRGRQIDEELRERLGHRAAEIAGVLNPDSARRLTFTAADKGTAAFDVLRKQLIASGSDLSCRGIFTIGARGGKIFGPETYADDDPVASPPGTVYQEPPEETRAVFRTRQPATVGPYVDEFGSFVTALAPLLDPRTGEVLLVVGLDLLPGDWHAQINAARRSPLMSSLVIVLLLAGVVAVLCYNRRRSAETLRLKAWVLVPVSLTMLAGLLFVRFP